jgi:hypothetical protein
MKKDERDYRVARTRGVINACKIFIGKLQVTFYPEVGGNTLFRNVGYHINSIKFNNPEEHSRHSYYSNAYRTEVISERL